MSEEHPISIDVIKLDAWRKSGEPLAILDVREPMELQICRIEGAIEIPLAQIPGRVAELPTDRPVVVYCHHGMRSMQAVTWLRQHGVPDAINLLGGIDAWAKIIDRSVRTY